MLQDQKKTEASISNYETTFQTKLRIFQFYTKLSYAEIRGP